MHAVSANTAVPTTWVRRRSFFASAAKQGCEAAHVSGSYEINASILVQRVSPLVCTHGAGIWDIWTSDERDPAVSSSMTVGGGSDIATRLEDP